MRIKRGGVWVEVNPNRKAEADKQMNELIQRIKALEEEIIALKTEEATP